MDDDRMPDPPDVTFDFLMPPEWEIGLYANTVNVWHSPYEFTLDWAVTQPAEAPDPDDVSAGVRVPATVVARVRIPVGLIFDVLRTLNEAMTGYEAFFGEIRRPGEHREGNDEAEPDSFGDEA
jgi:hypothetical protein